MKKIKKHNINLTNGQVKILLKKLGIKDITEIDVAILKNLKEQLKKLSDPRQKGKTYYKIWDIAMCVIIANFTNVYDWDDIHSFVELKYNWLRKFLLMTGGIPSAETYERVFSMINPHELETILNSFLFSMIHCNDNNLDIVDIDGRVDCGSSRTQTDYKEKLRPLNVLNAYSNNYGICLASEQIDEKTNEIPTIPIILERFNCKDIIITWDALNTQKENVKCVINKGGNYVVPVKGNQGNFLNDLELYFKDIRLEQIEAGNIHSGYLKEIEKSHSSTIIYEYYQTSDVNWYFEKEKWESLTTIGMVKKTIIKNNETKIENRYYISSLNVDINLFSKAIRNHWSVENKLHWHLDFTFREDKNTTANKQALMNLQLVNKFCLAILNHVKPFYNNISLRKIRNITSYNFEQEFVNMLCYLSFC